MGEGWNDDVETCTDVMKEIATIVSAKQIKHCTHLGQVVGSHGLRANSSAILNKLKWFKFSFRQDFYLFLQLGNGEVY